jgi:hypothetical protein
MKKILVAMCFLMAGISAFAMPMLNLNASVGGCAIWAPGCFECLATVHGGSGSYNYWWTYSGPGTLYQTNSGSVTIQGCLGGTGSLQVQVMDRVTREIAVSGSFPIVCGCSNLFGGGGCEEGSF